MTQRWLPMFIGALTLASLAGCGKSATAPAQSPRPDVTAPAETSPAAYSAANSPSQQAAPAATVTPAAIEPQTSMTKTGASSDSSQDASSSNSSSGALTDAQIAGITAAANAIEVDQAKLARARTKRQKVKSFADLMISHHQAAEQAQAKLGISEADSPIGTEMDTEAASTMSKLKGASGSDFDRTYIEVQVDGHRSLLALIDNQLLPNAKSSKLRAYLEQMKTKVEIHLQKAADTQLELGSSSVNPANAAHKDMPASPAETSAVR